MTLSRTPPDLRTHLHRISLGLPRLIATICAILAALVALNTLRFLINSGGTIPVSEVMSGQAMKLALFGVVIFLGGHRLMQWGAQRIFADAQLVGATIDWGPMRMSERLRQNRMGRSSSQIATAARVSETLVSWAVPVYMVAFRYTEPLGNERTGIAWLYDDEQPAQPAQAYRSGDGRFILLNRQ